MIISQSTKPKLTLLILDGFGINTRTPEENSITAADTPTFHALFENLKTQLDASGRSVGIPDGQMGNSEVGHMTIGAGRVIRQSLVKIDDSFASGDFAHIPAFEEWIEHVKKNNSTLHLFTLFGPGGVHAHSGHLERMLEILPSDIPVSLHIFTDGRDIAPTSFLELFRNFRANILAKHPNVTISSVAGRYYAMDRDTNWTRVQEAYDAIVFGKNTINIDIENYIEQSYARWINDEFIVPAYFDGGKKVSDGDSVFFLNFRSDRAKELTKTLVEKDFQEFERKVFENLSFVTMTKYYPEYSGKYFIENEDVKDCLAEILSTHHLTQLHIAETEKFAHVTKFFNGGKQVVFEGEKDVLIPSHKVATYDLDPEMSAEEIWQVYEAHALDYDFTVLNYANGDMVGHTGMMDASIQSVKKLDEVVAKTIEYCERNNIHLLITADHGNCEEMGTPENPKTAHTTNFVPFWYIKDGVVIPTKPSGWLANIAPTILEIMGIGKQEMMEEELRM
jgi:2,3-bisphosphoglycerate-independent phosphoglycerate mutase